MSRHFGEAHQPSQTGRHAEDEIWRWSVRDTGMFKLKLDLK
jgi:hypothetical protein